MKLRELYTGTRPFSYIIFDTADANVATPLLDSLDEGGYRYWFNPSLAPSEKELYEILNHLKEADVTILVLSKGVIEDALATKMIEYSIDKRAPFVIYMLDQSPELVSYLNSIMETAKASVVFKAWEQKFETCRSIKQALSLTKGVTAKEAEQFYLEGISVFQSPESTPDDFEDAMKKIIYAAGQEYPPALTFLGNFALEKARQGRESYSTAIAYYKTAIKFGNIEAIYSLGCMIADGEGFAQNYGYAKPYISLAAAQGFPDAQYRLACMLDNGNGISKNRTDATSWYMKALKGGDRRAYLPLAYRYLDGESVNRDETLAATYFMEAAEDGSTEAVLMLAKLYRDGVGVRKDPAKSEIYFRKAAEKEIAEAQYEYAMILQKKGNLSEAFQWFSYAALEREYGVDAQPEILFELGQCYGLGKGVEADRATAFLYYHKAALAGYAPARAAVAECYRRGVGVAVNKRAADYYCYES